MMRRAASTRSGIAPDLIFYSGVLLISLSFVALAAGLGGCGSYVPAPPAAPAVAPVVDGGARDAAVCRPCIWGQPLPGQQCSETQCGCSGNVCCCKETK